MSVINQTFSCHNYNPLPSNSGVEIGWIPLRGTMKALTKRAIRRCGSIKNTTITEMEKIEYRQTGMIKVKEPLSVGCQSRYDVVRERAYYDVVETPLYKLLDDYDFND